MSGIERMVTAEAQGETDPIDRAIRHRDRFVTDAGQSVNYGFKWASLNVLGALTHRVSMTRERRSNAVCSLRYAQVLRTIRGIRQ